ncbi:hypothetical protein AB0N73_05245 [Microbacterium sp. NPDC089189]|uniref:hypothetical protein n=1 Tax=Microbacterium sp. NPDC089189 TaxID=3154972 RepID=UPI003435F5FA
MDRPDVSPALLRNTGDDFARQLQARLIELADATDDAAYASRLRLVASGKRPLRTLLADPQWRASFGSQMQLLADPPEPLDEERRRALDDAVAEARRHMVRPTEDQVVSDAADVMRRARLVDETIREDELNGWTYVHDTGDGTGEPAAGDR